MQFGDHIPLAQFDRARLDDTTLDKSYAQKIDLVSRHWSGKHKRVVGSINLLSGLDAKQRQQRRACCSTGLPGV